MTIVESFALISLRLPFGRVYCPYWRCVISEFIYDVINALLIYEFWSLENLSFSNKNVIPGCKINKNDDRPFGKALPINVLVDLDNRGKSFYYIDNIITIEIESKNMDRFRYAVAIIIDLFG